MKKIFISFVIVLLTGCVSNADFEKECITVKKSNHFTEEITMDIFYDSRDITKKVIYTRDFKIIDAEGKKSLEDIEESFLSFNERYEGKGINIVIDNGDDEYKVIYSFDAREVDDYILKEFNVKKNSIKLFSDLKKKGLECEVNDGNN